MPTLEEKKRAWLETMGVLLATRGLDQELATVLPDAASGMSKWRGGTWSKLVEHVQALERELGKGQLDIDEATAALVEVKAARDDVASWLGKHATDAEKAKRKGKTNDTTRKYDQAMALDPVLERHQLTLEGWIPQMRAAQSVATGLGQIVDLFQPAIDNTRWLSPPLELSVIEGAARPLANLRRRFDDLASWAQTDALGHTLAEMERAQVVLRKRTLLFNEVTIYTSVVSKWPKSKYWVLGDPPPDQPALKPVPDTFESAGEMKRALENLRARATRLPQLARPETGLLAVIDTALDNIDLGMTRVKMLEAGDDLGEVTKLALEAIVTEVDGADHDTVFRESNPRTAVLKRVIDLSDTDDAESELAGFIDLLSDSTGGFAMSPKSTDGSTPPPQPESASRELALYITGGVRALLHALANIPEGVRQMLVKVMETNDDLAVQKGVVADLVALQWIIPKFYNTLFQPARMAHAEAVQADAVAGRSAKDPSPKTLAAKDVVDSLESVQAVLQCIANGTLSKRADRMGPEALWAAKQGLRAWSEAVARLLHDLAEELEDDEEVVLDELDESDELDELDEDDQEVIDEMVEEGVLPRPRPVLGRHRKVN